MSVRKIAIAGLEKKDKILLKAAIETASGFETGLWEYTDNLTLAQVIILDPEDEKISQTLEEYSVKDDAPLFVGCKREGGDKQKSLSFHD